MARYALRRVGVHDSVTGELLVRSSAGWPDYVAWLEAGGIPDPAPAAILQPPTAEETAARAELEVRKAHAATLRADATVQYLKTHTPAEVDAYVQAQVTDLASAKMVLRKLAQVVAFLARERLG